MASIELLCSCWGQGVEDSYWYTESRSEFGYLGVETYFYNASEKEIKYVTFTYAPYNAVSDVVTDVKGIGVVSQKFTGPIAPDSITRARFTDIWKCDTIRRVDIMKITVEFMDGTTEIIAGNDLLNIFNKPIKHFNFFEPYLKTARVENEWFASVMYVCENRLNEHEIDYNQSTTFYQKHSEGIKNAKVKLIEEREKAAEERAKQKEEYARREKIKDKAIKFGCLAGIMAVVIPVVALIIYLVSATS